MVETNANLEQQNATLQKLEMQVQQMSNLLEEETLSKHRKIEVMEKGNEVLKINHEPGIESPNKEKRSKRCKEDIKLNLLDDKPTFWEVNDVVEVQACASCEVMNVCATSLKGNKVNAIPSTCSTKVEEESIDILNCIPPSTPSKESSIQQEDLFLKKLELELGLPTAKTLPLICAYCDDKSICAACSEISTWLSNNNFDGTKILELEKEKEQGVDEVVEERLDVDTETLPKESGAFPSLDLPILVENEKALDNSKSLNEIEEKEEALDSLVNLETTPLVTSICNSSSPHTKKTPKMPHEPHLENLGVKFTMQKVQWSS